MPRRYEAKSNPEREPETVGSGPCVKLRLKLKVPPEWPGEKLLYWTPMKLKPYFKE